MVDKVSPIVRSAIMGKVRSRNTTPEIAVRKMLYAAGLRYRLHCADLPGKPDIVFAKWKLAIFTHGCFWHLHQGCGNVRIPKSRVEYWRGKLRGNRKRDKATQRELQAQGWTVLVVWECELANPRSVERRLLREIRLGMNRALRRSRGCSLPSTTVGASSLNLQSSIAEV